jgi:hypothetical protein
MHLLRTAGRRSLSGRREERNVEFSLPEETRAAMLVTAKWPPEPVCKSENLARELTRRPQTVRFLTKRHSQATRNLLPSTRQMNRVWAEAHTMPATSRQETESCVPIEIPFLAQGRYDNPFLEVNLDVEFTAPDGGSRSVPAFWSGDGLWKVRYASPLPGTHTYRSVCSETDDAGLHGIEGSVEVHDYTGGNPLYLHGPIRVAQDRRHFEHCDGTPFLWLGDTWWKALCRRLGIDEFRELAADRATKGFNVVQIVCGPYPDEAMLEERWENEAGKPYDTIDFSAVNHAYFDHSDRRIALIVESGMVPAIVGGWGRPQQGGRSTLQQAGLDGYKRHWRYLVARYAAYPVTWIVGGEVKDSYGPWSHLAQFVRDTDPYGRSICYHAPGHPREALADNSMFDFDMVAIGHDGLKTAQQTLGTMESCMRIDPPRPVLCGECAYERHMQSNFEDVQRHMFWSFVLSGAAGHTYGAAGVWQASIEGDPGIDPVYDLTTWRTGMKYPGAAQVGLGKKLLEQHEWWRFESHPEWTEEGCFAAGIPGKVRFIYLPKRGLYNWAAPQLMELEPDVDYSLTYFDPVTGSRHERGTIRGSATDEALRLPSVQDWVVILSRVR